MITIICPDDGYLHDGYGAWQSLQPNYSPFGPKRGIPNIQSTCEPCDISIPFQGLQRVFHNYTPAPRTEKYQTDSKCPTQVSDRDAEAMGFAFASPSSPRELESTRPPRLTSNGLLRDRNKKLVVTGATLVVTGALLVVTSASLLVTSALLVVTIRGVLVDSAL